MEYFYILSNLLVFHMPRRTKWIIEDLEKAVATSFSIREVIKKIGLIPAGGNYQQVKAAIDKNNIDTSHFSGQGWRKNRTFPFIPKKKLVDILVENSSFQSYKLKNRLFREGLKEPICEICSWAERSQDGRIPVELDHINGNHFDNRIENLRILCPNCHSLQLTHRGKNQKRRGGGIGRHATLKMS